MSVQPADLIGGVEPDTMKNQTYEVGSGPKVISFSDFICIERCGLTLDYTFSLEDSSALPN